jgi:hypothetical protein
MSMNDSNRMFQTKAWRQSLWLRLTSSILLSEDIFYVIFTSLEKIKSKLKNRRIGCAVPCNCYEPEDR